MPLDKRLSGVNINQEDLPWWAVGILNWLAMVKQVQESSKAAWSSTMKMVLEGGEYRNQEGVQRGPNAVYAVYSDFSDFMEAEALKNA